MRRMRTTLTSLFFAVAISLGLLVTTAQAAPIITSPPAPGVTLSGATATFSWVAGGSAVEEWWLYVGTGGVNSTDIYDSGSLGTVTTDTVSGLPTDGSTVYVRLWWRIADIWSLLDGTYVAISGGGGGGGGGGGDNHTLRWDQSLPGNARFVRVLPTAVTPAGEGVLDKETGLVWEQSPLTLAHSWTPARFQCMGRTVGDKKGWRLPSVHELASLVDPTNLAGNPDLPAGHPFSNVGSSNYWSASTDVGTPTDVWFVDFSFGDVDTVSKSLILFVWCVRGGGPLSEY